jgi:AcrR family transcriptional regulator
MVLISTTVKGLLMIARKLKSEPAHSASADRSVRERILSAAFAAFRELGYGGASTLEIATRARASKRELYALFDGKHEMLTACIAEHAKQIRPPLKLPEAGDRASLAVTLATYGAATLRGVCEPRVLAVYRLAIGESERSPGIAKILDSAGREANYAALVEFLSKAKARGLFTDGDTAAMAATFSGLLWGNLLIRLLLRVTPVPTLAEMERRAQEASRTLLALYPPADG